MTVSAETRRVPMAIPVAIGTAWLVAIVAELTGKAHLLHHDALIHGGLPLWASLGVFLLAWQVMIAAMMVPSSLPMIRLFDRASADQSRPGLVAAAFLGGYVVVWSGFGALAFIGDFGLHHAVDATPWLAARPWLIAGGALALAGAFQFSSLTDRCLTECRHPVAFLLRRYRRGVGSAFALGRSHGLFCLGCCWALMLLMFAAGVANLWWMTALTALMVYEKVGRNGRAAAPIAGVVLLTLAVLVILHPGWLPTGISSA